MTDAPDVRCSTCFFTTRFPGVEIREDGRCNHCHSDQLVTKVAAHKNHDQDELRAIAEEIKSKRRGNYDCIIGASGGLDSSYVIYIARAIMDLKPLVVRYDSGLGHPQAVENLENLCRTLGAELRTIRSRKGWDRRYVRRFIAALRDAGVYWGVCRFCGWSIPASHYRAALGERIDYLLTSNNIYEGTLYLSRDQKMVAIKRALRERSLWHWPPCLFNLAVAEYNLFRLKLEFYVPPPRNLIARSPKTPPMRHITLSRYIPWDIDAMVETLKRETGWKPAHEGLPMRFDCLLEDSYINHTFQKASGSTVHTLLCNNMIQAGLRTKDQLQEVEAFYSGTIEEKMRELEERLGG